MQTTEFLNLICSWSMPADTTQLCFMKCLVPPVFTLWSSGLEWRYCSLFFCHCIFMYFFSLPKASGRPSAWADLFVTWLVLCSCDSSPGHQGQGTKWMCGCRAGSAPWGPWRRRTSNTQVPCTSRESCS